MLKISEGGGGGNPDDIPPGQCPTKTMSHNVQVESFCGWGVTEIMSCQDNVLPGYLSTHDFFHANFLTSLQKQILMHVLS